LSVSRIAKKKAFHRLAKNPERTLPEISDVFLLDGLYPDQYILRVCEKNQWGYFITLKDKCLPTIHEAAKLAA